jgi:hypothetical protein
MTEKERASFVFSTQHSIIFAMIKAGCTNPDVIKTTAASLTDHLLDLAEKEISHSKA